MFNFLKSQKFWLGVAHIAAIGGGAYTAYAQGTPLPLVLTSIFNALAPSPMAPKGPSA